MQRWALFDAVYRIISDLDYLPFIKSQFLEDLGIGNKAPGTAVDTVNLAIRPADQKCGLRHTIELLL